MKRTIVASSFGPVSLLLALSLLASCSDDGTTTSTASGGSSSSGDGGNGGTAGSGGGMGGDATGGMGGSATGGMGGSAATCKPGETDFCYTGPAGTQIVGACKAGIKTCLADGSGFGPCEGEVTPTDETCSTMVDDDCDGMVNEEGSDCACEPNSTAPCYTGPMNTLNIGDCLAGTQTCNEFGTAYGDCVGEVKPQAETCAQPGDEDCDGQINESGALCVCTPNSTEACYTGQTGTLNVGNCIAGTHTCNAQGTAYGPCEGEITPQLETCATPGDEDCDGQVNESGAMCICLPNTTKACYTGQMGTQGVGACKAGTQACNGQGTMYGPCIGETLPLAESCATPVDDDCDGSTNEGCSAFWVKTFGDSVDQDVYDVATDSMGNIYVAGAFSGTVDFGGGPLTTPNGNSDIFVAKYDPQGNHLWSKQFGANGIDTARGLAVEPSGTVVVTGSFQSTVDFGGGPFSSVSGGHDIFVVALTSTGQHLLSRAFGATGGDEGAAVAFDSAGSVYVVGHFSGTIDFGGGALVGAGSDDAFIAKFSSFGAHLWSQRFGDAAAQSIRDVAVDPTDNVYVTGTFSGNIDFGGGTLVNAGGTDAMVVKFSSGGVHQWTRHISGANAQAGLGIAVDTASNVVVTGNMQSIVDFGTGPLQGAGFGDIYVAKYDSMNTPLWAKIFGDNMEQSGLGIKTDLQNNVLLVGRITGSADFGGGLMTSGGGSDIFLAKLNPSGSHVWSRHTGDALEQWGRAITNDPSNNVIAVGRFAGTIDFGTGMLPSAGGTDGYIVKFAP